MRRSFTTREKVLLVVLAVLLMGIGYFKLILEPINDEISQYEVSTEDEEMEITQNSAKISKLHKMKKELTEIHESGDEKPMPAYDNADALLVDLNTILSRASSYSLNFGEKSVLESNTYIMCRPATLEFSTPVYGTAREIIDALHDSSNINQISDLTITFEDDGEVKVTMSITYYELTEQTEQTEQTEE